MSSTPKKRRTVRIPAGPDRREPRRESERPPKHAGVEAKSSRQAQGSSVREPSKAAAMRIARDRRKVARFRRLRLRATAMVVALIVVAGGSVALYRSDVFVVEDTQVVGNARLTPDDVRAAAAVPTGTTLLRVRVGEIKDRLLANAWVAEASVTRDFPHTLRLRVRERQPVAIVDLGGTKLWLIDGEGTMLAQQTPETSMTLVAIRDIVGLTPTAGRKTDSEELRNALAVLEGVSEELRRSVRSVSAASIERTSLITSDDVEILVGPAEDLERKDAIARRILAEQQGKVVYVNVRTPERPTWRGLE